MYPFLAAVGVFTQKLLLISILNKLGFLNLLYEQFSYFVL